MNPDQVKLLVDLLQSLGWDMASLTTGSEDFELSKVEGLLIGNSRFLNLVMGALTND